MVCLPQGHHDIGVNPSHHRHEVRVLQRRSLSTIFPRNLSEAAPSFENCLGIAFPAEHDLIVNVVQQQLVTRLQTNLTRYDSVDNDPAIALHDRSDTHRSPLLDATST